MAKLPMRYLLYSLLLLAVVSCASDYKALQPTAFDKDCFMKVKPRGLSTGWFTASVDVVGKHLSGLLFIKNQPDSSVRVVFTSEAGLTFFDFEFARSGAFAVKQIVSQLDRKPVIQTLRKDFALALGIPFRTNRAEAWTSNNEKWYGIKEKKEMSYFITEPECSSLLRMESGSLRKKKTEVTMYGNPYQPDSIRVRHFNFSMQIKLRKLIKE